MMKPIFYLLIIPILYSCSSSTTQKVNADTLHAAKIDSQPLGSLASKEKIPENDCVFDTSSYKFTTDILREFSPKIDFIWSEKEKEATIKLDKNDTLRLHVGGCDHFSYSAIYSTSSSVFSDDSLLIDKAKWLAKTFF